MLFAPPDKEVESSVKLVIVSPILMLPGVPNNSEQQARHGACLAALGSQAGDAGVGRSQQPRYLPYFSKGQNHVREIRARGHTVPDHDRCGLRNSDANVTNRNAYPTNPNPRRYSDACSTSSGPHRYTRPTAPLASHHACWRRIAPSQ